MYMRNRDESIDQLSEMIRPELLRKAITQGYSDVSLSADVIVESAYEIVTKDEITNYCQEYTPRLTEQQYEALLSSKNTLHEVYEQWCNNGELHGLEDIGIALEETADRIKFSLDRERKMKQAAVDKVMEAAPEQKKEQAVMPKRKSR